MVVYFAVLLVSACIDVRTGKIPNRMLVILIAIQVARFLWQRFGFSDHFVVNLTNLIHSILIFAFLIPFFRVGLLGAGDLKLIFIVSLGIENALFFTFLVFLSGAVIGICKVIKEGSVGERISNFFVTLKNLPVTGTLSPYVQLIPKDKQIPDLFVHLSVSVFFAALVSFLMELQA